MTGLMQAADRLSSRLFALALIALLCGVAPQARAADPPSIVAWLGDINGTVTFLPANSDTWIYATPNRPLTMGDQVWVDQGSRAELHIGSMAVRMSAQTSLAFASLDDGNVQLRASQGTINVHVNALPAGQHVEVDTPNLAFVPSQPGSYRIDVDGSSGATKVTVWSGQGTTYSAVNGVASDGHVALAGEQAIYTGTDIDQYASVANPQPDDFDRWAIAHDASEAQSVAARYVSREIPGYETLDAHGDWISDPSYGYVWIPRMVPVGWAPYHDGHWVWIAPWGWTWMDDAPWGFAPCHYGRWAWARARWVWVPPHRTDAHPVYAPALVAFVAARGGAHGGARGDVTLVGGTRGVAWVPLAPGEAYRPTYHVSPRYITHINRTVIVNHEDHDGRRETYANEHAPNAMAAVPVDTFVRGHAVRAAQAHVDASTLKDARFVHTLAIGPTPQSITGDARPAPALVKPQRPAIMAQPAIATPRSLDERRANVPQPSPARPPAIATDRPLIFAPPAAGNAPQPPAVLHGTSASRRTPPSINASPPSPPRDRQSSRPVPAPEPKHPISSEPQHAKPAHVPAPIPQPEHPAPEGTAQHMQHERPIPPHPVSSVSSAPRRDHAKPHEPN